MKTQEAEYQEKIYKYLVSDSVEFYENERVIKSGILKRSRYIENYYHDSGNKEKCYNVYFKIYTKINFHSNGRIESGTLNGNQTIQSINYSDGDLVTFDTNGNFQ